MNVCIYMIDCKSEKEAGGHKIKIRNASMHGEKSTTTGLENTQRAGGTENKVNKHTVVT